MQISNDAKLNMVDGANKDIGLVSNIVHALLEADQGGCDIHRRGGGGVAVLVPTTPRPVAALLNLP
jgi:hypothetical protein